MYNITFQQIEVFLILAEHLNLSKAADETFISQPALSKMLQRFEEGIKVQLFTRSHHGLALTEQGKYLYSALEKLYNNINKAFSTAQSLESIPAKTLRIVAPSSYDSSANYDLIRSYVRLYESRYPNVVLIESLCDFKELRQILELGEADLAITQDFSISDMSDVSFKSISKFELFIAMSAEHPMASNNVVNYKALENEYFYIVPASKDAVARSLEQCQRLGFTPQGVNLVPNFQTLLHYIRQKKGMSICGRFNYIGFNDIKYFKMPESENRFNIGIAWKTNGHSDEARKFIELLDEQIQ